MRIQLSDHFSYGKLLRFSLPSVIMMLFSSIYGIVDGLFVSNFVGKIPFAAINLIMPVLMIIGAVGFMLGAGGTAIVSKTLGEGKRDLANKYFSMLVYVTAISGVTLGILGVVFLKPILVMLGAKGEMLKCCIEYGRIILPAIPAFMLQNLFQSFFVVGEKPKLGLSVTLIAGVTNMVLDALFVAVFGFGLTGAAFATAISQTVGGIIPLFYFARKNSSLLSITKTAFYGKALLKSVTNGSSELMSNISMSVVTIIFNWQLMKLEGDDGVAAYGVIMYVSFIFIAMFIGYAVSSAPIIGFHYGANNKKELNNLLKKSVTLNIIAGMVMTAIGFIFAGLFSKTFVGYDMHLFEMSTRALRIFSFSFIFSGLSIFGSSFFTALSNGPISALISFLRTFVFQLIGVLTLPLLLGVDGVWFSMLSAEILAVLTTTICIFALNKRYGYIVKRSN